MRRKPNPHKITKAEKSNRTSGISKGIISTPLQRYMCRRNRSWKHPKYAEVMASLGSKK